MILNNKWVDNENKEPIKKFLETNENEHTTVPNLSECPEVVLRGKFIVIQTYLKKDRNISNKQPYPTSTRTRETMTNMAQSK